MTLQFIPPMTLVGSKGCNPCMHPLGVWQIARKLRRTGYLHKVAVWSLTDTRGLYSPPTPHTLRVLRMAMYLHRQGEGDKLQQILDESLEEINDARARKNKHDLRDALRKFFSAAGNRQYSNRVFFGDKVDKHFGVDAGKSKE